MTAIAYRDGVLAVDSQCTWGAIKTQTKKYYVVNVYNIGDCVVALSGSILSNGFQTTKMDVILHSKV